MSATTFTTNGPVRGEHSAVETDPYGEELALWD
jgi:hypothetical protein